jgi:hypothetical protein
VIHAGRYRKRDRADDRLLDVFVMFVDAGNVATLEKPVEPMIGMNRARTIVVPLRRSKSAVA